jgi:hypothetical protein
MKQLVWFNPGLAKLSINDDRQLYWHRKWYEITGKNVCLVDSTGISKTYDNGTNMQYMVPDILGFDTTKSDSENGKYWHFNFSQLMRNLSDKIFDKVRGQQELRICYSGGTDSATTLASLMSNERIKPLLKENRFIIYTTPFAKIEDPAIWNRIVQEHIPLRFLDYDKLAEDSNDHIMVTGDGEGYGTWWQMLTPEFSNEDIFLTSIKSSMLKLERWFLNKDPSGFGLMFFKEIMSLNSNISNLQQAWTWFENCVAIQCYMYRATAYSKGNVQVTPRNNWIWFMADKDFWDMCDYESYSNLYTDDKLIKYQCLKYIANWMGTEIVTKNKINSQILVPKIIRKSQIFNDNSYSSNIRIQHGSMG